VNRPLNFIGKVIQTRCDPALASNGDRITAHVLNRLEKRPFAAPGGLRGGSLTLPSPNRTGGARDGPIPDAPITVTRLHCDHTQRQEAMHQARDAWSERLAQLCWAGRIADADRLTLTKHHGPGALAGGIASAHAGSAEASLPSLRGLHLAHGHVHQCGKSSSPRRASRKGSLFCWREDRPHVRLQMAQA
jgi:hypothetical protein